MKITWEAEPPRVRYSVNVGLDEEDLDRLAELAPNWPADHELRISEQREGSVVQDKHAIEPGAVYVAARGGVTALDRGGAGA